MSWQTSIWTDIDELSRAAAGAVAQISADAVRHKGRFDLVLAGGHTPRRLYKVLATEYCEKIPWSRTHLFWGDERYVTPDDPLSNYRMARESLIDPLSLPSANVHPFPTSFTEPDEAARAYEGSLRTHFGAEGPKFDLALLGIGPEGHTASLFPGSPALTERERWVVPVRVHARPPLRLTLTLAALNAAAQVFFLVSGADKREIVDRIIGIAPDESSEYPAARVRPRERVVLFVDRAARPEDRS